MANTETKNTSSVKGQIDATGAIGTITVKGGKALDVAVNFDTGTFSGTIVLEREMLVGAANAAVFTAVDSFTATENVVARSAATRRYRLNCTTDSGGAITSRSSSATSST
jgi:hypothetical protein